MPSYVPEGFDLIIDDKSAAAVVLSWMNDRDDIIACRQTILRKDVSNDDWIGLNSEGVEQCLYYMDITNSVDLTAFEKILNSITVVL